MDKNKEIINLTQHNATPEQITAGVIDASGLRKAAIATFLTFEKIPNKIVLNMRARALVDLALEWIREREIAACGSDSPCHCLDCEASFDAYMMEKRPEVMIGGAPYFMRPLENALRFAGFSPLYSFSVRKSQEQEKEGKVIKIVVFKHLGFVR